MADHRVYMGRLLLHITWFGLYCGLMLSVSAFSIDIILPAFPGVSAGIGATSQQVQLIVPVYLLALGVAHPLFGALSDRYGRKIIIYLGLVIFCLGALACMLSTSLPTLLAGRFLQGFGAASGTVVCRAMIRDRFSGAELAQNMAVASMFFAIGPVLAPLIGYMIYALVGWRGIFAFLIVFAVAMAGATYRQEETLSPQLRRSTGLQEVISSFILVYKNPQSRFFILVGVVCTCLIITFLENAQVVYEQLGADSKRFAYLFAFSSMGIIAGQVVNYRLIRLSGVLTAMRFGATIVAGTSFLIMVAFFTGLLTDIKMTLLMLAFHTSYLIIYANVVSLALDPHRQRAATAAAVFGFTSYVAGSALAALITFIAGETLSRWSVCFFLTALLIFLASFYWKAPE